MGELFEQLREYSQSDYYPYHMPGHKRQVYGNLSDELARMDITEIDGFDNLHRSEGILKRLQVKAADIYGADESYYLINGSTCGILSAVSAAIPFGGHILMARNCHKAAYHAAYLRNLTISYLYPPMIQEYDICDGITPKQVEEALEREHDINAVFLVSPSYEGRIADIKAIAEVVHAKNIPLIVDEAHGAHLGLVQGQRANSCQQGADLVIHSVHKTLPAMTQTALLHVNGDRIDRNRLRRFLHIYQSTSPSYVLMASIDNALQVVVEHGEQLFAALSTNFGKMMEKLSSCKHLCFLPLDHCQDIGKLVISSHKTDLSGQQIYDMLLQEYHLQLEMAAGSYCLAMFTVGDTEEAYERMTRALLEIDARIDCSGDDIVKEQVVEKMLKLEVEQHPERESSNVKSHTTILPLSEAWDKDCEEIPLQQALGRYVGEFINLYPPGIPLLVPGERLQEAQLQQILWYLSQKMRVQGVSNEEPYRVKVLTDYC